MERPVRRRRERADAWTLGGLRLGVAVPFLYYGTQVVASLFFPGYSFVRQAASILGSEQAPHPWVFNAGALLTGAAALAAAPAFLRALLRLGAPPLLAWLTAAALATNGAASVNAGLFPLPDPRHASGPLLLGALLLPGLVAASVWSRRDLRALRAYLLATTAFVAVMVPVMGGQLPIDLGAHEGVRQRLATLALFPPIGVSAYALARSLGRRRC
jgi:hypothetical membrane protein